MSVFNEIIVPQSGISGVKYGISVLNPDGSLVGGGNVSATPYKILAYYDDSDTNFNYSYYAEALPGTSITEPKFRCFKIIEDKNGKFIAKLWAGTDFNHLGDEASVKSLTYN